jgi:DNA-binding GntR family transcriptional regulator
MRTTTPEILLLNDIENAVEQVKVGSIGDRVYDALLSRLISLRIPPGSRIAIDALVREFGVSQTPIRAALIRLESEGLVQKVHNVGYSAAPMPTRRHFEDMFDMRLLLEPYMAFRAAGRITPETRNELEALARAMTDLTRSDAKLAYGKFALLDAKFHACIASQSENDLAAEALNRLYAHTHMFRLRFHSQVTEEAILEHAQILAALSGGDADGARSAMIDHISASRARMAPFFESID